MDREPEGLRPCAMDFPYRDYLVRLAAFAFLPLWGSITGLTYLSAHAVERQWILVQAFHYAFLFGMITIIAPLVKLLLLSRWEVSPLPITPRRLLWVTIMDIVVMFLSVKVTVWVVWGLSPVIGLNQWISGALTFCVVFVALSGLLSVFPNLALVRGDRSREIKTLFLPENITHAAVLGLISPVSATLVVRFIVYYNPL